MAQAFSDRFGRSACGRRAALGAATALVWLAGTGTPARAEEASAQETPAVSTARPDSGDGARRRITLIQLRYARENPAHPPVEEVLGATLSLVRTEQGYVAPRAGERPERLRLDQLPSAPVQHIYDSALPALAASVVARLQELGLIGVYVEPDPTQLRVEGGRVIDNRPAGDDSLTLVITTGTAVQVRSVGLGERLPADQTVNNAVHARIREHSPVKPALDGAVEGGLLRRDELDRYVFRLNRHPGRRVDVAVAPTGEQFGGVSLDYLITENRPWLLFAQISNTGTESTSDFRERFGFIHNQLTNNDDIFSIDYLTGSFRDLHAVTASYDRPLFDLERWRWKAFASGYTYEASDVGQAGAEFEGTGYAVGGEITWNFLQSRDLFLDAYAGARYEHVDVENRLAAIEGDSGFFIPSAGLRLERVREASAIFANAGVEWNVEGVDTASDLDPLGRFAADDEWVAFVFGGTLSFYIEPLFTGVDEPSTLAHEIVLQGRGQVALDDARLVPNYQQVAGGLYSVRGYPEAVVAGDTVYQGSAEYRFHLPRGLTPQGRPGSFLGTPFRWAPQYTSGPTDWDLIFKGFIDAAHVENNDRQSFEVDQTLIGAGVGLELVLTRRLTARVDWGFALEDVEDPGGGNRVDAGDQEVHFVVTVVF